MYNGKNCAYVLHRTATRLRIRVPGRRHDHAFFDNLRRKLTEHDEVLAVEVNTLTASVLIVHGRCFGLDALRRIGIHVALDTVACHAPLHASPTFKHLDENNGKEVLSVLAKLVYAAVTGRLGAQILELVLEWCLGAVIDLMLRPKAGPARVLRFPQTLRPPQGRTFLAAA